MKYDRLSVSELYSGAALEGFFILQAPSVKASANGSKYLTGKLQDKTGNADLKIWNYAEESGIHKLGGKVIKIRGNVEEYNGNLQVVVDRVREAQKGEFELGRIVPTAPIDVDRVIHDIECGALEQIADPVCKAVASKAFARMKEAFRTLPAAKSMHHAFVAGLLMHTHTVMKLCALVADVYGPAVIDKNILLTGALCHDMGKRFEFLQNELGLVTDYSVAGHLLGHLVMGAQEIAEIGKECGYPPDNEKIMLLQHMILAHHGKPEWGAAVEPKTIEAEILSQMDLLDSRVESCAEVLHSAEFGSMTEKIKAIGRPMYKPGVE